jgi:hypothetical protein
MSDIEEFLKSYKKTKTNKAVNTDKNIEEVQQLLKPPIRDTKNDIPHIYNNITEEGYQQQADLLYLPTDAFGYKYCLVVVDVGTSKCDAQQLKHKTDIAVKNAFIKLYARKILEKPTIIRFDQGSEFKGLLKKYFEDEKVIVKYSLTNRHRQQALVEQKNKQIGNLITAYQTNQELKTNKIVKRWVKQLPFIVKYLNKHLPKRNYKKLTNEIMTTKFSRDLIPLHSTVRHILDYPLNAIGNKVDTKFRSGDIRWSRETSEVKRIVLNPNIPPLYILNNKKGVAYTKRQLQVIKEG